MAHSIQPVAYELQAFNMAVGPSGVYELPHYIHYYIHCKAFIRGDYSDLGCGGARHTARTAARTSTRGELGCPYSHSKLRVK